MSTGDKFVNIVPKKLMGFLDFRDRFLDYTKAQLSAFHTHAFGQDGFFNDVVTISFPGRSTRSGSAP